MASTFAREFLQFLRDNKRYWLVPLAVTLIVIAGVLVLVQRSAPQPFFYRLP